MNHTEIALAMIAAAGSFYGVWQKIIADRRTNELDKFKAVNDGFRELYETVKKEMMEIKAEVNQLRDQIDKYKAEITMLSATEHSCQEEVKKLQAENKRILDHLSMD